MTPQAQRALLALSLHAAFADGVKDDREREAVRGIADSIGNDDTRLNLPRVYQDVLLGRLSVGAAAGELTELGERQYAYEMAVCVCEADGRISASERQFLNELRMALGLDTLQSTAIEGEIGPVVEAAEAAPMPSPTPNIDDEALDRNILNTALLNGALELLPQSWASMAIIPMQIRMVYSIGQAHGVELDQGHIKEFIAAAGVGLTSQYLEQFGRKLIGGLLGKAAGKTFGKLGGAATGMAFSFATTYALGQVAKRYYAGGRNMSTDMLRDAFQNLLGPAKQMQAQYLPQIEQKAQSLDMNQIMSLVRGQQGV